VVAILRYFYVITQIEDLLISFSCNYNVDATRVSEFVDISIEQAQVASFHVCSPHYEYVYTLDLFNIY